MPGPRSQAYAVAARKAAHIAAAVNFAREKNLGWSSEAANSYLGASNARDSLMIWTRAMDSVTVNDAFVAQGCEAVQAPQPAVTVGAGAIWMHVYDAVSTRAGRYVQGGGCGTVGVAGLVRAEDRDLLEADQGQLVAALLEAEISAAIQNGAVRIANTCSDATVWALKGGGSGWLARSQA